MNDNGAAALASLRAKATPGEWGFEADSEGVQITYHGDGDDDVHSFVTPNEEWTDQDYADAAFITAAANFDWSALAARLERVTVAARKVREVEAEPAYSWVIESRAARHEGRPNREVERMDRVNAARRELRAALDELGD